MRLLAFFSVFMFVFALGLEEADARRFGGGASKGTFSRQMNTTPKAAPKQVQQQQQKAGQQAGAAKTGGLGGGLLGGMLAGGLLAALFFGGAFENIQLMDLVVLGLIAFGVIYFLRRRKQASPENERQAYAFNTQQPPQNQAFTSQQASSSGVDAAASQTATATEEQIIFGAPSWFNEESFLAGAKEHFMNLQTAWNAKDLSSIQEYVTPQLFKLLQADLAQETSSEPTQVLKLAAELSNIQQLPNQVIELAVMFHGELSEDGQAAAPFSEMWHLIRDMQQENAPWLIQGIEQLA